MAKKCKKIFSLVIILLLSTGVIPFGTFPFLIQNASATAAINATTVTVQNSVKDTISEGVGWNAENIWSGENHVNGDIVWSEADWTKYNNLVKFLKPQMIRFGVSVPSWSPQYDTYDYNSNWMLNNYKQLDAFKSMEADILIGAWWTSGNLPDNYWWSEVVRNGASDTNNFLRDDAPYNCQNWTDALADCINYLINTKDYTNIKWVSLWNEPNWNYNSANASYPPNTTGTNTFWPMYNNLATSLTNEGIRGQIAITGPENSWPEQYTPLMSTQVLNPQSGQPQQFGQIIDAVAIHDYDSTFEYDTRTFDDSRNYTQLSRMISNTMNPTRTSINNTYTSNNKTKPDFFITEIGNTMYGAAYVEDKSALTDGGIYAAEQTVRYLNEGYDGILRWNLTTTCQTDIPINSIFRPIDFDPTSDTFRTRDASYYSAAVLSRYMTKDSDVYNSTISNAGSPQRVFAAPLKGNDGSWTIFLVNDDFSTRQVNLDLTSLGLSTGQNFYEYIWSTGNPGGIECGQNVRYRGNAFNIALYPRSVMAFTTKGTDYTRNSLLTVNQSTGGITTTSQADYVNNNGFESGSFSPWTTTGSCLVQNIPNAAYSGSYLATINTSVSAGEIDQSLSGELSPGNYVLRARLKTDGTTTATLGVKDYNGSEYTELSTSSSTWNTLEIPFTVPAGEDSATIYFKAGYGGANTWANADEFIVMPLRSSLLFNGSFEDNMNYWNSSGSVAYQSVAGAHSGTKIATVNTSLDSGSIYQTITGLAPGQYSFTGYIKAGGGATAKMRVSGYGGNDLAVTTTNTYWTHKKIDFTIPSGNNSVTVYFESNYAGANTYVNGDDFELKKLDPDHYYVLTDYCSDFSKMYSHTANLYVDGLNASYFGYDTNRITRSTATDESIIYHVPDTSKSFYGIAAVQSIYDTSTGDLTFYTSLDNVTYTALPADKVFVAGISGESWGRNMFTAFSFPAGTKYVKISVGGPSPNWNTQLGEVNLYYK